MTDNAQKGSKSAEMAASAGLLILAASLVVAFVMHTEGSVVRVCQWAYAVGALVYATARVAATKQIYASTPRLRRLVRIEAWAAIAFVFAAAFWFYNEQRLGSYAGILAVMRPTVMLTLAGAVIQIVTAVLTSRIKNER